MADSRGEGGIGQVAMFVVVLHEKKEGWPSSIG